MRGALGPAPSLPRFAAAISWCGRRGWCWGQSWLLVTARYPRRGAGMTEKGERGVTGALGRGYGGGEAKGLGALGEVVLEVVLGGCWGGGAEVCGGAAAGWFGEGDDPLA